jgi:hypothetical protein
MDAILGIGFRIMISRETHTLEKLNKQKLKLKAYT